MKCRFLPVVIGAMALAVTGTSSRPEARSLTQATGPAFEVASVKANRSGTFAGGIALSPGRLTATNVSLRQLIRFGYNLLNQQIVGGPNWIDADRFDIVAVAGSNVPIDRIRLMVQQLLTDRFAFVAHGDTRVLSIYALLMVRDDKRLGPQLRRSQVDCAAIAAANPQAGQTPTQPGARLVCEQFDRAGAPRFVAGGVTMAQLAKRLSAQVDRVVSDTTELSGPFDFELEWTPAGLPARAPGTPADQPVRLNGTPVDPDGPALFTALREQLGLRLDSREGPVDVLVIDRASQPTLD